MCSIVGIDDSTHESPTFLSPDQKEDPNLKIKKKNHQEEAKARISTGPAEKKRNTDAKFAQSLQKVL